ncbi:LCP family protein [Alkalihalobacillus oceani]|uniref:LCP family protein n=1 Tax=Halalkalibacter oceani TaxID=1653776 RepID=UPI00203F55ED|nr:LCP family protein [Halalkalibacter oceani]
MSTSVSKGKKWRKNVIWGILLLAVAGVIYISYFLITIYGATKEAYVELERPEGNSELREEAVTVGSEDPISILLMGVDDYDPSGHNGRADSLIVVTLNPNTKQITMTTIPRDTRVEFSTEEAGPYAGFHKINAAYMYGSMFDHGGHKLTVEKVEKLLDIPIDEYVAVNFDGFKDIVNVLGGVTVDIKEPFWEKNFYSVDEERIYFTKGKKKLDGEEALAFVRMRKREVNNVYSREERQRQFIKASIDEVISTNTLFKIGEIANILGENIKTSLSPMEIFRLQQTYASINTSTIKTFKIEGEDQRVNNIYYFIPTEEGLSNTSQRLKEELELSEQEKINIETEWE